MISKICFLKNSFQYSPKYFSTFFPENKKQILFEGRMRGLEILNHLMRTWSNLNYNF